MIITLITDIENFGFVTRCSQALEKQYFIVPYPPRCAPLFPRWQSNRFGGRRPRHDDTGNGRAPRFKKSLLT